MVASMPTGRAFDVGVDELLLVAGLSGSFREIVGRRVQVARGPIGGCDARFGAEAGAGRVS
jgi:hypothetical protein